MQQPRGYSDAESGPTFPNIEEMTFEPPPNDIARIKLSLIGLAVLFLTVIAILMLGAIFGIPISWTRPEGMNITGIAVSSVLLGIFIISCVCVCGVYFCVSRERVVQYMHQRWQVREIKKEYQKKGPLPRPGSQGSSKPGSRPSSKPGSRPPSKSGSRQASIPSTRSNSQEPLIRSGAKMSKEKPSDGIKSRSSAPTRPSGLTSTGMVSGSLVFPSTFLGNQSPRNAPPDEKPVSALLDQQLLNQSLDHESSGELPKEEHDTDTLSQPENKPREFTIPKLMAV